MTIGMNLRKALSGTILALAMAAALIVVPLGAQAKNDDSAPAGVSVCNTASQASKGGGLSVDTSDPQDYVHNNSGLRAMNGGSYNAAMHSRALSLCSVAGASSDGSGGGGSAGPGWGGSGT